MGQAAVDLPDPMEPPVTAAGTDELLAQLAGEEIDRLLAEADSEHSASAAPQPPAPAAEPLASQDPSTPSPNATVAAVANAPAGPAAANAAAQPGGAAQPPLSAIDAADAQLSAQLDDLFASLTVDAPMAPAAAPAQSAPPTSDDASATEEPATPAPAVSAPAAEDSVVAAVLSVAAPDAAQAAAPPATTSSEPKSAPASQSEAIHPVEEELRATEALERAGRAAGQAAPRDDALTILAAEEFAPLPFYLRPLEWLSAPLDAFPESVRDVMGKIAILTTVNAVAVLVYVFIFRKH